MARRLDHITQASKEALKEGKDNAEKLVALHEQRSTMGYSSDAPPQSGNSSLALSTNTSLSNSPVKHQPAVPNIFNSDVDEDGATMSQHSIRPSTAESSASQTILVQLTNCQDLVVPHLLGSTDPFVVTYVFWNGEKIGETETIWFGTAHPSWKNAVRNTFRYSGLPITRSDAYVPWSAELMNYNLLGLSALFLFVARDLLIKPQSG